MTWSRSGAAGQDCAYSSGAAYAAAGAEPLWATYANMADTCCKACAATEGCVAANYYAKPGENASTTTTTTAEGRRRLQPERSEGFGLHLVDVYGSSTAGGLDVAAVEAHFAAKVANFSDATRYDAFFDYNVVLYATDVDAYAAAFEADGVPTLRFSWPTVDGETWHSLLVHVPASQMILELVSSTSTFEPKLALAETRMSNRTVVRMRAVEPTANNLLSAVAVTRATTDLDAVDAFYVGVLGTAKVLDVEAKGVAKKCYAWGWAESDVCFVQRADAGDATFAVKDLEAAIWATHATVDTQPSVSDKYADNHYAMDLPGVSAAAIVQTFTDNYANIYPIANKSTTYAFTCEQHYIIDPTGWSIQTDLMFPSGYPGCSFYNYNLTY